MNHLNMSIFKITGRDNKTKNRAHEKNNVT